MATVEEALKIGADAVSIHVNVGAEDESHMLSTLGEISRHCQEWGMPLLAMMYPRGKKIKDEYSAEYIAHAARVGAELGADIVKTNYTGDQDSFARGGGELPGSRGHCRRAESGVGAGPARNG